jgi:phosphoglycerate dehydrogenase-like enzyme
MKLLVISADQETHGAKPGPHTFHLKHTETIRAAISSDMELIVATPEEAPAHYANAVIIAGFPTRIPNISQLPSACWLHSFSAGVDTVLTPEVIASDIMVTNSSGIHATPIAEHIMGICLMFTREFHRALRNQMQHVWAKDKTLGEIRDKIVLIVGLGEIGTETARLAHAFGARMWATSRSAKNKPEFVERIGQSADLDAMLPEADFVVVTLPHTSETHHLFDAKKFALMQSSGVLINIGRGSIINEPDLIDSLQRGVIAGAGLDVFETEPLPENSPLWDMEQVIITPHNSGLSNKYMDRAIELFCKNLRAYLAHEPLPNEVDKKLGY